MCLFYWLAPIDRYYSQTIHLFLNQVCVTLIDIIVNKCLPARLTQAMNQFNILIICLIMLVLKVGYLMRTEIIVAMDLQA